MRERRGVRKGRGGEEKEEKENEGGEGGGWEGEEERTGIEMTVGGEGGESRCAAGSSRLVCLLADVAVFSRSS